MVLTVMLLKHKFLGGVYRTMVTDVSKDRSAYLQSSIALLP
jgi:hypothetical protein